MNRKLSVILILSVAVQSTGLQSAWRDNLSSWIPSFSMPSVDVNAATEYLKNVDKKTLLALAALGLVVRKGYNLYQEHQKFEEILKKVTFDNIDEITQELQAQTQGSD